VRIAIAVLRQLFRGFQKFLGVRVSVLSDILEVLVTLSKLGSAGKGLANPCVLGQERLSVFRDPLQHL